MPPKKQPGVMERAARQVASKTTGQEGGLTNLKRGIAMIGALVSETLVPSKDLPTREQLKAKHEKALKAKGSKKATAAKASKTKAMSRSAPVRRAAEKATGVSRVTNPLRAIAKAAASGTTKPKKKKGN